MAAPALRCANLVSSHPNESGVLNAGARILRADNGSEVTVSDLARTDERPLVWSLDERKRRVARPVTQVFPSGRQEAFTLRWPPAVKWRQLPTVIS
jgi:hypothetical protein